MTNEQRVRVDRLERYLIADRNKVYTNVRVNDLDTVLSLIKEYQKICEEYCPKETELKQLRKQIDLMAKYISKQDIEEDICMKNKTNPD